MPHLKNTWVVSQMKKNTLNSTFAALAGTKEPTALATVVQAVSPTAASPGDKALVSGDRILEGWNGGGCAQPAVIAAAAQVLRDGKARLIRVAPEGQWDSFEGVADFNSGCLSGGTLVIFVEALQAPVRLAIYGCSPLAVHLSRLAEEVGFAVALACPDVDRFRLSDTIEVADDFAEIDGDLVVIATQGRHDKAAIGSALCTAAQYIAMVASAKKFAGLKAQLIDTGMSAAELDRIQSPAGVDIGAVTPAEVALSVLAQLVEQRRTTGWASNSKQPALTASTAVAPEKGGCCGG